MRGGVAGLAALVCFALPRLASAQCVGRPTDAAGVNGFSYGAAEVKSYATNSVRVHYATSGQHAPDLATTRGDGVPDTVAFAADVGEDALAKFAQMGFRAPPSDASCASNGGDAKIDVYLVAFTGGDGTTVPEACNGRVCSSFVLSESKFTSKGYADAKEGFSTVVPHELFHAVQNAYDRDLDRFWAEGTAQWAMKTLHPELQDFERQLPGFFKEPERSIDTQPSGVTASYLYGSAVWPLFLTLKYGDGVVRSVLEAETDGTKSLAAVDKVLATKGSSLAEAFPMFAAWNVATKTYAGTGGYPDAAKYPGIKVSSGGDGTSGVTSGLAYAAYAIDPGGTVGVSLETDATRNGGVLVPLDGGKARIDRAQKLPANADGPSLVVIAGITTKKTDAPFTIRFGAPVSGSSSGSSGQTSSGNGGGGGGGCACATTSTRPGGPALLLVAVAALVAGRKLRRR
jgi:MYXO-CTERM domain-containing protein